MLQKIIFQWSVKNIHSRIKNLLFFTDIAAKRWRLKITAVLSLDLLNLLNLLNTTTDHGKDKEQTLKINNKNKIQRKTSTRWTASVVQKENLVEDMHHVAEIMTNNELRCYVHQKAVEANQYTILE